LVVGEGHDVAAPQEAPKLHLPSRTTHLGDNRGRGQRHEAHLQAGSMISPQSPVGSLRRDKIAAVDDGYGPIVDFAPLGDGLAILETFGLETPWTPYTGRIIRRDVDGHRAVVADGLNNPIGLAVGPDRALYVTTDSYGLGTVEGLGHVLRVDGEF
jgi:hypothetical protein